ncbi:caspase a-like isoform X2 [Corythoichthys intestinalis]|uniref:caspase a-like isoform X1 n=1 Tax=Corythoichthys intestinalis TaxID=161448 RepID=UPI0025A5F328|nr:caspase a-like isoform X1 [Corythoichthys intestinalis]XP_057694871.1 caspase a-like isoform X1 [Corythoichthys intestinalis]XP_057694872.1 caspase a-like isoform X2 [Corythoichthys intestinalis]
MAEELKAVRTEFANKVSSTILEQVMDNLLDDNVFNPGESEAILDVPKTRAQKARHFIETVSNKGDDASWKMIHHLYKRDPKLAKELGLPAQSPQAASLMENKWSSTLIPCKTAFWNSMKNNSKVYPVTKESIKNRVALLITNIKFKDSSLNRDGAEADEQNMHRLLRDFGYEVVPYTNCTGEEINEAVINFSKHPKLQHTDSVIVVIMSHGKLGSVCGVNWNKFQKNDDEDLFAIDNIFKHLDPKKCQALLDKPKLIIIQACRGVEEGSVGIRDDAKGLVSDSAQQAGPSASADDANIVEDGVRFVHKEKDLILFLSCTPGTVSYRHPIKGSLLIQFIVDALYTHACEEHIEEIFRIVMYRFGKLPFVTKKQMPSKDRCTLEKQFYLFPGIDS